MAKTPRTKWFIWSKGWFFNLPKEFGTQRAGLIGHNGASGRVPDLGIAAEILVFCRRAAR